MKKLNYWKYGLIIFSILIFFIPCKAQNGWTKKADLPTPRVGASASVFGNGIYVIGGSSDGVNNLAVNEAYDPLTDTWETKKPMPTPRNFLSTTVVDGIIYAIGGNYNTDGTTTVEAYDPLTDVWIKKQNTLSPRFGASACDVNGIIYNVGGNHYKRYCDAYDPKTDSWTGKTAIPETEGGISVTAYNGLVYAFGGGFDKCFSTLYAYDLSTDIWTKKKDMPTARVALQTCLANGKIYALGGYYSIYGEISTAVEVYDPASNSWEKKADMPTKRAMFAAGAVNDKIYIIGGTTNWSTGALEIWEYDPSVAVTIEAFTFAEINSYQLGQNYPNPFNPSTTISWQSPVSGWQTLKIYDVLGREIETLVDEYKEAGNHSALYIVNSTLPSGVYFYQLKAGNFVETKKMLLLK